MTSSGEEGECFPASVSDYEFLNQKNEYVSLACLPIRWCKDEAVDSGNMRVYLSGLCDDGLQKLYKQVVAWRFELAYVQPEISVLCKGNYWVKLLKPKRLYESAFRSVLITIHCLHYVKHNHNANKESIWNHLSRVFSTYEVPPSEIDCVNHLSLIRDAAECDITLANSEYVLRILSGQPLQRDELKMVILPGKKPDFIVSEDTDESCKDADMSNQEEELFDTCCALCDNGGDILCCEGRCMRSFHATLESGEDFCDSLGFSEAEVNAIPSFICPNCQCQQHQCFICGDLGSSDLSLNPEVFPCIAANCGRFYHPKCVFRELQQQSDTKLENLEEKIASGEPFVCPSHRCFLCKMLENRTIEEMQFAVCRRCPKSYHRKCLPREIAFAKEYEKEVLPRAWDGLLPKRVLIYCLDHEMDPELRTPLRDHIRFPDTIKAKIHSAEQTSIGFNVGKTSSETSFYSPIDRVIRKTESQFKKASLCLKGSESLRVTGKEITKPNSDATKGYPVLGKSNFSSVSKLSAATQPGNANTSRKKNDALHSVKPLIKKQHSSSVVNVAVEKRITDMMEEVKSKFNVREFMKTQKVSSMYTSTSDLLDKHLTKGKVEVAVKAIREALQTIDKGGSIDDAKTVCSAEMLRQVPLWKMKLKFYLGPFLHGRLYSSYGRHFTKLEKLQEVVNRLHWYVQDGDMIVDFCCGANDFSRLMKEKLDSVGKKKCSFKNFDLFPPKNDFNFEQKNWFDVDHNDLPADRQLIMGLNPPFGYKASLANKFISKALNFNPKLLILIVPPETQRLDSKDRKKRRYDLLWEDRNLLAGEAFYLPGAFDAHDKEIGQWNNVTPPLYLWSRPDWTWKHREIAIKHGHVKLPVNLPQQDCQDGFMNVYSSLHNVVDDPDLKYEPNLHLYKQKENMVANNI